jgi:hypothetical protein
MNCELEESDCCSRRSMQQEMNAAGEACSRRCMQQEKHAAGARTVLEYQGFLESAPHIYIVE